MERKKNEVTSGLKKFLSYELAGEVYISKLASIREVLEIPTITFVPRADDRILGVVNIRGLITTVIDGKKLLSGESITMGNESRVIVFDSKILDSTIGMVVDRVLDVVEVDVNEIAKVDNASSSDVSDKVINLDGQLYIVFDEDCHFSQDF